MGYPAMMDADDDVPEMGMPPPPTGSVLTNQLESTDTLEHLYARRGRPAQAHPRRQRYEPAQVPCQQDAGSRLLHRGPADSLFKCQPM